MKKTKLRLLIFLFVFGNLAAIIQTSCLAAQFSQDLFPPESIQRESLVLQPRGDQADVYFAAVSAEDDAFQIVAVLQGALVDKNFYSNFASELARFGFVVVVPNHFQILGPPGNPPALFSDQFVVNDVLAQMILEDTDPNSPLFGIVDTERLGLTGHSFGGATGLFAIEGSCKPPFCFGFYQRPKALRAGVFYGTNTFDTTSGTFIDVNTDAIPVALVQGSLDGIATVAEAQATFELLDGLRRLIPIEGANHYGIANVDNPPAIPPSFIPPMLDDVVPTISQTEAVTQIALATGKFLSTHLKGDLIPGDFPIFSSTELIVAGDGDKDKDKDKDKDSNKGVFVNQHRVTKDKINDNSGIGINGNIEIFSQFLPSLVPSVFPQNRSKLKIKVSAYDPPFENDSATYFKEIVIKKNQSARFTGGGPFHIGKLKIKKQATLELAAGTYFINELDMKKGNGGRIKITSEPVKLHIGKKFNISAKRLSINKDGNISGLVVYLHRGSQFQAKQVDFTGLIYGPENKRVQMEKMTLRGAVIVGGKIELKTGLNIIYTEEDREAVNSTIITP